VQMCKGWWQWQWQWQQNAGDDGVMMVVIMHVVMVMMVVMDLRGIMKVCAVPKS
jgi:hypothetical protein